MDLSKHATSPDHFVFLHLIALAVLNKFLIMQFSQFSRNVHILNLIYCSQQNVSKFLQSMFFLKMRDHVLTSRFLAEQGINRFMCTVSNEIILN